jgi:PAS domain S-box-containing protein
MEHENLSGAVDSSDLNKASGNGSHPRPPAEDELRKAQALTDAVLDSVTNVVFLLDHQWRYTYLNSTAVQALGRPREQILGHTVWQLCPDIIGTEMEHQYRRAMNEGIAVSFDFYAAATGAWWENHFSPTPDGLAVFAIEITQRKQMVEKLREYEKVVEGLDEMIAVVDRDYRYLIANRAFLNYREMTRDQVVGRLAFECLDPAIFEQVVKPRLEECFQGTAVQYEMKYTYPKLGERDLLISYFPIEGPAGIDRVACILRDVTESKQAEGVLHDKERFVNQIAELTPVVLDVFDLGLRRHTYFSSDVVNVFGYTAEELMQMEEPFARLLRPDDMVRTKDHIVSLGPSADGAITEFECRIKRRDGKWRWMMSRSMPFTRNDQGEVQQVVTATLDITERKRAEKALREAEQKYRDIFENAGEGIFQSTPNGRYLVTNPALAQMHGFDSPEEMVSTLTDISREVYADPRRRQEFKDLLEKHDHVRGFEHQIFRRDGTKIWISVNARAVRDGHGKILYYEGTTQDINQRKLAEARSAAFGALAQKLSGSVTQLETGRIIAEAARELFGWDACNFDLYDAERDVVYPMLNVDTIEGRRVDITAYCVAQQPSIRSRGVIDHGPELLLREDPVQFDKDAVPFGDTFRPSASIMSAPVRHGSKVVGVLAIHSYTSRAYDAAALDDLETLADYCGEALNRIHAEELLYESEERFRQLAEHFEDVVWMTDPDIQRVVYINPAYERVFRRTCESLYQNRDSFLDVIHPEDRGRLERGLDRQRNGHHEPAEYRIFWPDGSVRWILRRSFPIRNTEGEIYLIAGIAQDITERKRAQEELRESEERYRDLVENSRELICTHDLNGVVLSANRAAVEVLGYDQNDFVGRKNFRDLLVPEFRDQFDDYLARIRRDGFANGMTLVQTQSGERRILEYHNTLRTEGVTTPIVRGMANDITERKRAEDALRESESFRRTIVESEPECVELVAPDYTLLDINPAGLKMLAAESREQVIGQSVLSLVAPEWHQTFKEMHERVCLGDSVVAEYEVIGLTGLRRRMETHAAPLRNRESKVIARLAITLDISSRKLAEQALRESEERYRELFENAKDAIYVHDLSGRYTSLNHAAEKIIGYSRDEIIGKHFSNFVAPRDLKHVRKNLCKKLDDEGETSYEVDLVTKDRRRVPVEVSSRLIYENGQAIGVQGTARDITERKRSQEALQIYSRRLIEAQEAERQSLARELHDEIGQVLTAVRINLQTVQSSCRNDASLPHVEESIVIVDEALGRIRDISLELRPSLLDDLGLASALRWYVDRYGQRTGIVAEVLCGFEEGGRLPRDLETECFRIAQEALTNVARHAHASRVRVQLEEGLEELLLTIADNGIGFDSETLLQTTSSALTLGLRGMRERVLAMEGRIEIESAPGNGTKVRAVFPLTRPNLPR